ncbi:MAG: hypothetical protein HYS52_01575 [Candidatus Wildermuthbacteria bacterium]|nr:hypothetical protein [Candidatus Wildermuthbacteria bacterium]
MQGLIQQCGGIGQRACDFCDLFALAANIINFVLGTIVPPVAALLVVMGGFYLLTSGGDPQKQTRGKTILTAVVIGLIIVYAGWLLINTIFQSIGVAEWAGVGKWWRIECQ